MTNIYSAPRYVSAETLKKRANRVLCLHGVVVRSSAHRLGLDCYRVLSDGWSAERFAAHAARGSFRDCWLTMEQVVQYLADNFNHQLLAADEVLL